VYWSWNYTTWTTNELDTETVPVRLLLALMLVSLLIAVAIPQAFEAHALLFAGSYVAIQIGRHVFLTFAAADRRTVERERAGHILSWFAYLQVSDNRTILARDAYTYPHVVFVAGIILSAVGDELVIAHPTEILPPYEVATVAAGPAVYLFAHTLFGYRLTGLVYKTKLFGTLACLAVGFAGLLVPALVLARQLIVVLVAVIGSSYLAPSSAGAEGEAPGLRKG
jgi:low temperature requirement protein LtrA